MVDFSLRKTKAFQSNNGVNQPKTAKNNPYASLKNNNLNSNNMNVTLPSIAKKDQEKIGKLMQRRMSIHQGDLPKTFQPGSNVPALPKNMMMNNNLNEVPGVVPDAIPNNFSNPDARRNYGAQVSNLRKPGGPGAPVGGPIGAGRSPRVVSKGIDLQDPAVIQLLSDSQFDPEQFISSRLNDSTASDIDKFNNNLTSLNKKISSDIKQVAYQTYEKLLNATKELNSTDSELKILRNALSELSDVTNQMKTSAQNKIQSELEKTNEVTKSNSQQGKRRNRAQDRSSILVLEKMWANEMTSLFKHVEGAQKYIAAIPGRHVIAESGRWYELNAATFKTLQPAHIFLLNDLILVATRKRKTGQRNKGEGVKQIQSLVADQCWPLREVQLIEINPNGDEELFTINIRYNSLSYIYQTDRRDHYQKILSGYKKARDELRDISEAETIKQRQLRDSMTLLSISENGNGSVNGVNGNHNGGGVGTATPNRHSYHNKRNSNVILQDLSTRMHSRSRSMDNSNTLRSLKKIDDMVDESDVAIFHQNFDESLNQLDDIETELSTLKASCNDEETLFFNVINLKISTKKDQVVKSLINLMKSESLSTNEIKSTINSLTRLKMNDVAKTLFLNNRTNHIESLTKKVEESNVVTGLNNIADYIVEITIVKVQNIKSSIQLYKSLFETSSSNLSYLVEWGIEEIKKHVKVLRKSLQNVKLPRSLLQSSILIIHRQVVELKQSGLDVEYLFDEFYRSIDTE